MKKIILSAAVLAAASSSAFAQTAAAPATAEPASPHAFTGNVAVVSDYRFRGISQTFRRPAIQGGFDYSHSSGFYVGNWNSSVSGVQYPNGGSIEMDLYGGYKFEPVKDVTLDVGGLYYYYPGSSIGATGTKFNNGELYIGASWKWLSAKYSHGVTNYFGLNGGTAPVYSFTALAPSGNSRGSSYLDLNANFEIMEKTTLTAHIGRQTVRHYGELSYTDYKLAVARDFGFATLSLAAITTNANDAYYTAVNGAGDTRRLGKATAVLSLSKTF